jgi:hypothetical protein
VWWPLPPDSTTVPVDLTAASVIIEGDAALASDVRLTAEPWRWRAERLVRGPTRTCPDAWSWVGAVVEGAETRLVADTLTSCPGGAFAATNLRLSTPRFRLASASASSAASHAGVLTAESVRLTACACDDPPWTITASRVDVAERTAWATWPVLRLGSVPVLTAPAWSFPLEPRRFGLLAPEVGWRGDDGPAALQPLFIPLTDSADLTPAAGWGSNVGPLARLASRWHVRDRHRGAATLTADARGVSGEGQGTLGADEAFLALEGRIATAPEMYAATARAPEAAFAPHVAGRVGVAAAGSTVAAAARLTTLSDRRAATRTNLPTARLALSSEGEHLRLDADVAVVAERVADGTAPEGHTVDSTLAAIAADSVGPFRLAARAVAETLAAQHDDAQSTTVGGHLGASFGVAARRTGEVATHTTDLTLNGLAAGAGLSGDAQPTIGGAARPTERMGFWAVWSQRLVFDDARAQLATAWGRFDAESRLRGTATGRPWASVEVESALLETRADWDGATGVLAAADIGPAPVRLTAAYLRTGSGGPAPLLFARAPERPETLVADVGAVDTLRPGLAVALGPLDARWEAFVDAGAGRWLGHAGTARWSGRCQCWRAGVRVEQATPAPAPDVWFTLALTGVD